MKSILGRKIAICWNDGTIHFLNSLTQSFHVPAGLFSARSQMMIKFSKNQKSSTQDAAKCLTDVLTIFDVIKL